MTDFSRSRFQRFLRKEGIPNRFFYAEFDPTVLEEQKVHHERSKQDCGEPSMAGLKDPKEERPKR
jgi:hypothetical protein